MASDFYPPFIGGAERQVQLLSRELAMRGHAIEVVTIWHKGLLEHQTDKRVSVHRVAALATKVSWFSKDPRRRYHPPFPDPAVVVAIRKRIRHFQPDLVHAHGWIAYSCAAALLGTSIPLLISVRDYGYTCAIRTMLYKGREICSGPAPRKCLDCAALTYGQVKAAAAVTGVFTGKALLLQKMAGTHSITSYVQRITRRDLLGAVDNPPGGEAVMVPDFVIPSFFEPSAGGQKDFVERLPTSPFILFVGALQPHKGLYELLSAYDRLERRPPLVLIGTRWPDTPQRFPDGVSVYHDVPHGSVMAAWERCLFGVVPSLWPEPLGVVSLEAMSKGKAVVATAVGGITDIVLHGRTGLLVPAGDPGGMTDAMQRLVDDAELRESLGREGLKRVQLFTADVVIPRFEQLYRQLLAGTPEPIS
jgi:glycosyltransferase involved in cell wall biosynthesis